MEELKRVEEGLKKEEQRAEAARAELKRAEEAQRAAEDAKAEAGGPRPLPLRCA